MLEWVYVSFDVYDAALQSQVIITYNRYIYMYINRCIHVYIMYIGFLYTEYCLALFNLYLCSLYTCVVSAVL